MDIRRVPSRGTSGADLVLIVLSLCPPECVPACEGAECSLGLEADPIGEMHGV